MINSSLNCKDGYTGGSYHKESNVCKEKDDYWILWSRTKFISYFRDGIYINDPIETTTDDQEELINPSS